MQEIESRNDSVTIQLDSENSILQIGNEKYELVTSTEDPTLLHTFCLRPTKEPKDSIRDGFRFYETGRVHRKLLLQRSLSAYEKDRIKTRQEESVLQSRSRTSKLLTGPLKKRKRQLLQSGDPSKTRGCSTTAAAEASLWTRCPTSLSQQDVNSIMKRIQVGEDIPKSIGSPVTRSTSRKMLGKKLKIPLPDEPRRRTLIRSVSESQTQDEQRKRVVALSIVEKQKSDGKESELKRPRVRDPVHDGLDELPLNIRQVCRKHLKKSTCAYLFVI